MIQPPESKAKRLALYVGAFLIFPVIGALGGIYSASQEVSGYTYDSLTEAWPRLPQAMQSKIKRLMPDGQLSTWDWLGVDDEVVRAAGYLEHNRSADGSRQPIEQSRLVLNQVIASNGEIKPLSFRNMKEISPRQNEQLIDFRDDESCVFYGQLVHNDTTSEWSITIQRRACPTQGGDTIAKAAFAVRLGKLSRPIPTGTRFTAVQDEPRIPLLGLSVRKLEQATKELAASMAKLIDECKDNPSPDCEAVRQHQ
jgi:hypothetical protein